MTRFARLLLAGAASLLGSWLVIRAAAVNALAYDNPFAAAVVAPNDPRVRLNRASIELLMRGGRVSPATLREARESLRQSALADEPFVIEAVQAMAAGDSVGGERLLNEARRRDPRSRLTRLLLLDRYLKTGRTEPAADEIAALTRLIPNVAERVAPELARMVHDTASGAKMGSALRRHADLRQAVLLQLVLQGASPDVVLAAAGSGREPAGEEPSPWRDALLQRLVEGGDLPRALHLWQTFAGLPQAPWKGLVDSQFTALPSGRPFGWSLTSGGEGTAERGSAGTLQVEYLGRAPAALARQLLVLSPGAYRLGFGAQGDAKGEGTQLVWTVTCSLGGPTVLTLPLVGVSASPKSFVQSFVVPSGCGAQWLTLAGKPGDVAAQQEAVISHLSLTGAST